MFVYPLLAVDFEFKCLAEYVDRADVRAHDRADGRAHRCAHGVADVRTHDAADGRVEEPATVSDGGDELRCRKIGRAHV